MDKIQLLRADLVSRFAEREHVIDGCLAAVLAKEHVLLVGPPGTAKSALVRSLAQAFGGTYFERLLTKFSTPDELFGPVSLRSLENDKFERNISGKLPTVQFAFVDEVFRSSSAILNSLLTLMNERLYHNDGEPIICPLVSLFGASNDLPDSGELDALSDRFLIRFDVQYLTQYSTLKSMLTAPEPEAAVKLTMDDLRAAQAETQKVEVSDDTVEGLIAIRSACYDSKIVISDRRWKRSLKLVQSSAYAMGERVTSPEDLHILTDILWREPKEREKIARIVSEHGDPIQGRITEILTAAHETAKNLTSTLGPNRAAANTNAIKQYEQQKIQLAGFLEQAGKRATLRIADAQRDIDGLIKGAQHVPSGTGHKGLGAGVIAAQPNFRP